MAESAKNITIRRDPTGVPATQARLQLNTKFSRNTGYHPHTWHSSLDQLRGDERILCVGIDTSEYAKRFAGMPNFSGHVDLVDLNPSRMMENRALYLHDSRFDFHEALLWNLPFRDSSYDVIVCTYTLHRLTDPVDNRGGDPVRSTLVELTRVAKLSSKVLFATHSSKSFKRLLAIYRDGCSNLGLIKQAGLRFTHFDPFLQESAFGVLENYFDGIAFDEIDTSLSIDQVDAYMQYWDDFPFPGRNYLEPEMLTQLRAWVEIRASQILGDEGVLIIDKPTGVFVCNSPKKCV